MKIHLVDGTYELFRHYYAAPSSRAEDGAEVGAARGIARSLLALLAEPEVTHVAVAFDHVVESFRNELFSGYKTGEGIAPALYAQFAPAEEACRALGLVTWPMVEFEADDALATAAARFGEASGVEQVVICSTDKDLAQCIRGGRVVCLDRMRRRVLDEDGVVAKFGVPPASIPDWLALVGDTSDGLPGILGWGPKSTATVLGAYRHLEHIPLDARDWTVQVRGADKLASRLSAARDEAFLYRNLATLRTDVPLTETLDDLGWRGPDDAALAALAQTWKDRRIVARADELRRARLL